MRITHVIPSLAKRTGGPANYVAALASWQSAAGHSVSILSTDATVPANSKGERRPATFDDLPPIADDVQVILYPQRYLNQWAYSPGLAKGLNDCPSSTDILHIHSLNLHTQYSAFRVAQAHEMPYLVSPHGSLDPFVAAHRRISKKLLGVLWQDQMLGDAAALHATSHLEGLRLASLNRNVVVVPSGISDSFFEFPVGTFFETHKRRHPPLIVNHGRLSPKKGLDVLVSALPYFSDQSTRIRLIGPDDEGVGAALRHQAMKLGVADRLQISPPLYESELSRAIVDADVWCLPSHAENFGLAVVEAMALGCRVVVSPGVDIGSDAAAMGAAVISTTHPKILAGTIENIYQSPDLQCRLSEAARTFAEDFRWANIEPQMTHTYAQIMMK